MNATRWMLAATLIAGCNLAPEPTRFERACAAANEAMRAEKVQIFLEDCAGGQIQGEKDGAKISVNLRTLPDGAVRVEFHTSGPDQALLHRISRGYDERMGR